MNIIIENIQDKKEFTNDIEALIKKTCEECLKAEQFQYEAEISILIVDNEQIREMNKEHRNIDKATDVLSFPMTDIEEGKFNAPLQVYDFEDGNLILGDIVLSLEKAYEQAAEYGHAIEREIAFLISHGVYHLLGFDHESEAQEKIMMYKQDKVLASMGLERK